MTYNILIVEDNLDQSELIRIVLERSSQKFDPKFLNFGEEAIDICNKEQFDAVILDYKLPDFSGIEILTKLRNKGINFPVIIVTGQGDEKIAVEAMKCGAADYIVKEENYLNSLPKTIISVIEKHHLQLRLKEKEEFLANVIENANDIIFSLDQNSNFRFINNKIKKLNYQPEELVGESFFTILSDRHSRQDVSQILLNTEEKNFEFEFVNKNGKIFNQIISFSQLVQNGSSHFILGIAKDVTKTMMLNRLIQESKNKLQTLFDSITDYIVVLDRDKKIVMANKKVSSLHNKTPDRILGQKCMMIYSNSLVECNECIADKTWQTSKPEFMERSDEKRIYQMWTYPMFNLEGELEYVIEYSRDVTDQKNIERTLIQSEKLATIGLLASGVAHELRNPLNIIETARYYIQDVLKSENPDLQSKLQIIKRNVIRSSKIINNLLEFSQHSQTDHEQIDVNQIIDKTLSLIEKDLQAQSIVVIKKYNKIPRGYLNMDSIKQVFLNIIINAIHAMPVGGKLVIATELIDNKRIQVKFIDEGIGIHKDNLSNIFTPFFTTKEMGKGTGLGMYVSHSIIKREGGDIFVDSVENEGTSFTVQLPIKGEKN